MNHNSLQNFKEFPIGWVSKPLGEVLPISYGKSLITAKRMENGAFPVFGSSGQVGFHSEALTKKPALIIGRKGSVGEVYHSAKPCWPIDTTYFVEEKEGSFLPFFYYLIRGLRLGKLDKSTTIPGISRDDYNNVEVAFPAENEQKRIVAEIEKQFSRLNEAVASLKRAKANLKRYKAAVLKAAVEGKLTEQWRKEHPDVEPAEKLLQRILAERRAKWEHDRLDKMASKNQAPKDHNWRQKYKEPEKPKNEDTFKIPKTWVWSNIGQLAWSIKDGPHYSPKYSDTGIPFISGGNVRPEGIDFSSAKYITPDLHNKLSDRCKPEYGDLLYTKGGTTGIARVNTETQEFNVWVHVAVLKLVDSIDRFYLQNAMNSPFCYMQSQKYTHGVGNQDLGLTRMIWISIPIPPANEQKAIVREIEEKFSIADKIDKEIGINLNRADHHLRQSILKRAFSGKLVSQDPNDEPAAPLLERIRSEQERQKGKGVGAKIS